jgi:hypothetical protein
MVVSHWEKIPAYPVDNATPSHEGIAPPESKIILKGCVQYGYF